MQKQLAVLLPSFDNSKEDLEVIKSIGDCLKKNNISHEFFVCSSSNHSLGYKLNFLFKESLKEGYEKFACHDNEIYPLSEKCNYDFSGEYPLQVASEIDNESITYSNTFGCVLFSKNHYQTIKGVNNDLDLKIDLLNNLKNRFKNHSLLESLNLTSNYKNKAIAQFDGESSSITIQPHDDLKNLTNKSFSFFFLVKPEGGDENLTGKNTKIPLLSRCGLEFLSYDENGKVYVSITNTELKTFTLESRIVLNDWNMIFVNINIEESKLAISINGHESTKTIPSNYKMEILHYLRHPIVIGSSCSRTNVNNKKFKGELAIFGMLDSVSGPQSDNEYGDYLTNKLINRDCKVLYEFSKFEQEIVTDQSENKNNGILKNIHIKEVVIEPIQYQDLQTMEGHFGTSSSKERGVKELSESINCNEIKSEIDNKDDMNSLRYSIDNIETINDDIKVYSFKSL